MFIPEQHFGLSGNVVCRLGLHTFTGHYYHQTQSPGLGTGECQMVSPESHVKCCDPVIARGAGGALLMVFLCSIKLCQSAARPSSPGSQHSPAARREMAVSRFQKPNGTLMLKLIALRLSRIFLKANTQNKLG